MRINCKRPVLVLLLLILLAGVRAPAQQPYTQTAPIYAVNAEYTQGVAPGFWPTSGGGLVLNMASGTSVCNSAPAFYPGGSLNMTPSVTNYVYIDPNSCVPSLSTTGYPAGAVPIASVSTNSGGITGINDERTWFQAGNGAFAAMANASSFSGSSVGAQIDNACASLGGKSGVVVIPATLGAGQSLAGLGPGCAVLDLRGSGSNLTSSFAPHASGDENVVEAKFLFRDRLGSVQPPLPNNTLATAEVYHEAFTGGTNVTGTKSNYFSLLVAQVKRTPGQSSGFGTSDYCYSSGDCIGSSVSSVDYGQQNAGGDEGAEAARLQVQQGTIEFTGTITAKNGNTLTYNNIASEDTRGEQRLLLDTSATPYSAGNVSSIAIHSGSTGPAVTGDGTGGQNWQTAFGGDMVTNSSRYCFSMTNGSNKYGSAQLYVLAVQSVTGATTLTLNDVVEGVQADWGGDVSSGAYSLVPCSTVTALGLSGSLTVADATKFNVGDNIRMALGDQVLAGLRVNVIPNLPSTSVRIGVGVANLATRPITRLLSVSGNVSDSILYVGAQGQGSPAPPLPSYGLHFEPGNWAFGAAAIGIQDNVTNNTIHVLGVERNNGQNSYLSYSKQDDTWSFNGVAEISPQTGQAGFGVPVQTGWWGWFQPPSGSNSGVMVNLPANSSSDALDVDLAGIPSLRIIGNGANGSTWRIANGANLIGYSDNQSTQSWNINSATGSATFSNLPPVYNVAGSAQTGAKLHLVEDQVTLAAGSATVTLAGAAAFSTASSYKCGASDQSSAAAVQIACTSGSQFAVSGTGTDVVSFVCVGN
jgi:hypothetical protein